MTDDLAWKPRLQIHGMTVCLGVTNPGDRLTYSDVLTRLGSPRFDPGEPFAFAQEEMLVPYIAVGPAGAEVRLRVDLEGPDGLFRQTWMLDLFQLADDGIGSRCAKLMRVEFHAEGMHWFVMHDADDPLIEYARCPLRVGRDDKPDGVPEAW